MCEPSTIALASFALSAVSTGAGLISQQQQMRAQEAYNQQAANNARIARDQNISALEWERTSAAEDAREQKTQNMMALRRAQSTARVASGEAGVSGLSVDALLRDLSMQAGYDNAVVDKNFERQNVNINARRENTQISMANTINSLQPVQTPNYLGAALQIGQSGLGAYRGYQQDINQRRNNPTR